jgi:hypothetical protein
MIAVFFGCWDAHLGHFLWLPNGKQPDYRDDSGTFGYNRAGPFERIDGQLPPKSTTAQSAALLHHRDGWTALAMHDYSQDKRGNSNANFIFDADLDFDAALAAARERFPAITARIEVAGPVVLVDS